MHWNLYLENAFKLGALKEQELNEEYPHSLEAAF
jgi:hypothetical protein